MMDTDVLIVGAGPAGLMLAGELCVAGVRPLVLERQPRLRETPKANGFNGQIVELLRYRGLLDRVEAASARPIRPAPAARSAVCSWTSHTSRILRCGRCLSRNRGWSACSTTTPANSAPAYVVDTRRPGSARTMRR